MPRTCSNSSEGRADSSNSLHSMKRLLHWDRQCRHDSLYKRIQAVPLTPAYVVVGGICYKESNCNGSIWQPGMASSGSSIRLSADGKDICGLVFIRIGSAAFGLYITIRPEARRNKTLD
jgi:hypothetical protein